MTARHSLKTRRALVYALALSACGVTAAALYAVSHPADVMRMVGVS